MSAACSCGEPAAHVIATRQTSDGVDVLFWHDGAITDRVGTYFFRGRHGAAQASARLAGEAVAFGCEWFPRNVLRQLIGRAYLTARAQPHLDVAAVYRRARPPTPEERDAASATRRRSGPGLIEAPLYTADGRRVS